MKKFTKLSNCQFRFLIVDDDPLILQSIKSLLNSYKLNCATALNGEDAIKKMALLAFDIVITDIRMPHKNGLQLLHYIKEHNPEIDVIIITAYGMEYSLMDVLNAGAIDYLLKPFSPEELIAKLNRVVRERTQINTLFREILERKQIEAQKDKVIAELKEALTEVQTLQGIIPICAKCKKIRDDKGYWSQVDEYLTAHTEAQLSHGICPDCVKVLYPHSDLP